MFGRKKDVKQETAPIRKNEETFMDSVPTTNGNKELVEEMFADALDCFFCTDSKLVPGEKLCVIRLEDLYTILCDRLDVDPEDTQYSSYAH